MTVEKAILLGLILLSLVLVATVALLAIGLRQEIITKVIAPETPPEILGSWGSSPRCQEDSAKCLALYESCKTRP